MNQKYEVTPHNVWIDIKDNGIYFMERCGATGKTYLGKQFEKLLNIGFPVVYVTWKTNSIIEELEQKGSQVQIILLDRFDLYCTDKNVKLIEKLSKNHIILLDLKKIGAYNYIRHKFCYIRLTRQEIYVSDSFDGIALGSS